MAFKACPDCGERVYELGCVNCNEAAYIEAQAAEDDGLCPECGGPLGGSSPTCISCQLVAALKEGR